MRALALDIGEKRTGVAVSDASGRVAMPLKVVESARLLGDARMLRELVADYEADVIVVGLPLSLDGSEGPQAVAVRRFATRLATFVPVPFDFHDERLSSSQAKRSMAEAGASERQKRGSVDMVAAALFLQSYLDARREPGSDA